MELIEFIVKNKFTNKKFALECDIGDMTLRRILNGENIDRITAEKIRQFTDGKVVITKIRTYPSHRERKIIEEIEKKIIKK